MKTKILTIKARRNPKNMTKVAKAKLERIAIEVCNRHLGTIPHDRQTLEDLEAIRVRLSSDGTKTEVTKRRERIYEHLCVAFKEWVEGHVPLTFTAPVEVDECAVDTIALDDATLELWEKIESIFLFAWREVARRENCGQDVERKLNELAEDLVAELTVACPRGTV